MNTISPLLHQAFQLRKDKKTDEALTIYESLWQQHPAEFSEWDGWSYGQCLQEKRRYPDTLELCRQMYLRFKTSEKIGQLYAWSIYYTQLAGDKLPENKNSFIKAITAIVQLSPPGKPFSPAVKSIFKLVKFLGEGNQNNWNEIGDWLLKLDKVTLSRETYTIDIPGRRRMELASELEEWFSWQSKWLLQTKQWQRCSDLCSEALKELYKWHYSNDIWFARRNAAALAQLGHKAQAREILQSLIKRKPEWFIMSDLAELTEDSNEALKLYAKAALAFGDVDKKIRVFFKMAQLFVSNGDRELAYNHALLVMTLRVENKWPVSPEVEQLMKELNEVPVNLPSSAWIVNNLKPHWERLAFGNSINSEEKQLTRVDGKIDHFIKTGEAGFIKTDIRVNKIYFLFKNYQGNKADLKPGLSVTFIINKSFDKKKNRESEIAVRIKKKY
jgi:tetratricopeptide (TPR) repeat protein